MLAAKPDNFLSILGTHKVERESQLLQVVLMDAVACTLNKNVGVTFKTKRQAGNTPSAVKQERGNGFSMEG